METADINNKYFPVSAFNSMWTNEPNALKRTSITATNKTGPYAVPTVATLPTS